ncbi:MAG: hypothetical protein P4L50_23730 [Anaerolineaceae bacterium]|nr:hypothetical protein [Anaerolineaceae bacterium]
MNNRQLDNKVRKDAAKVRKDLAALVEDSSVRYTRIGDNLNEATNKAKADATAWVENNVSQLSGGIGKIAGDAKENVVNSAAAVKKDVGHGLSQYNVKVQKAADKVPGNFGKQAARYPWVAISIALGVGFLFGILLKPSRPY